jgi:hypothetical protein
MRKMIASRNQKARFIEEAEIFTVTNPLALDKDLSALSVKRQRSVLR